jgi:hypothetical protein
MALTLASAYTLKIRLTKSRHFCDAASITCFFWCQMAPVRRQRFHNDTIQDKRLDLIANWQPRANEGPPVPRRRASRKRRPNSQAASIPVTPSPSGSALPWRRRGRISAAELLASNASTPATSEFGVDSEPATPLPRDGDLGMALAPYAAPRWPLVGCLCGGGYRARVAMQICTSLPHWTRRHCPGLFPWICRRLRLPRSALCRGPSQHRPVGR